MCRAELQTLSKIVPDFTEQVDFYLVSYNEPVATLVDYISSQRYIEMTAAEPVGAMLRDLNIVSQSSMLALDASGIIAYRKGFGSGGSEELRAQFSQLAQ